MAHTDLAQVPSKKKKSFGILQNPQEKKNIRNLLITKERLPFIWKVFISKEKE